MQLTTGTAGGRAFFLCLKPYTLQGRTRTDTPNQKVTLCISDN
nr:MAG TPA: hypothetical protein [Caudoviricetes sp.]